jgi:chaperone required for assembly of F1-ATPase
MSGGWAARRFWLAVRVVPLEAGFTLRLDSQPLMTPGKAPLVVPTRVLAEAIAAEWEAQDGPVRPETMPLTRASNSAIDNVATSRDAVVGLISEYGATDLLCYRATQPEALRLRESAAWDPLLDWAEARLGAKLVRTAGVMFTPQPESSLAALCAQVDRYGPFGLTALHDLVAMSGSLVIGLAAAEGIRPPEELWDLSRVDEAWQVEQWGADEEAEAQATHKRQAFLAADRFMKLSGAAEKFV